MIKLEKDLYNFVENYLIKSKNCISEYVGNELHLGQDRGIRVDNYGLSNLNNEKTIYFLEGKLRLDGRIRFSKVLCEAMPLLEYADYVYIFGIPGEGFEEKNIRYIEVCKLLGIGILFLDELGNVKEFLEPKKNIIDKLEKKEMLFRIFIKRKSKSPIANLIFQSTYEYALKYDTNNCAPYIEVYNALLSNTEFLEILNRILKKNNVLNELGMRKVFQNEFNNSDLVNIQAMNRSVDDYICITPKGLKKVLQPILLD